jgi:hypothetical protein
MDIKNITQLKGVVKFASGITPKGDGIRVQYHPQESLDESVEQQSVEIQSFQVGYFLFHYCQ